MKNSSSNEEFVRGLEAYSRSHYALTHPYLSRMANGEFPDMVGAIRDFAYQYSFYSSAFTQYLGLVLEQLDNPDHVEAILENIEEEEGRMLPEMTIDHPKAGMSHAELFKDFQRAIGVNQAYKKAHPPVDTVKKWRQAMLSACASSAAAGVGAIGMATESIVPQVYQQILTGIVSHTDLNQDDYIFFEIHAECDIQHSEDLLNIAAGLADTPESRRAMRNATARILNMRSRFWDDLLARAGRMPANATQSLRMSA
jgi:pyrroloquinoline quinone (PQQ) biosynthesis protein C